MPGREKISEFVVWCQRHIRTGPTDLLNLILVCAAQKMKDRKAKVTTAQTLWIPAVMATASLATGHFRKFVIREMQKIPS